MTKKAMVGFIAQRWGQNENWTVSYVSWARDLDATNHNPHGNFRECFRNGYWCDMYPKCTGRTYPAREVRQTYLSNVKYAEQRAEKLAAGEKVYGPATKTLGIFPLELFT